MDRSLAWISHLTKPQSLVRQSKSEQNRIDVHATLPSRLVSGGRFLHQEAVIVPLFFLAVICAFFHEVVFEDRTLLPIQVRVMGFNERPWAFHGALRANAYDVDSGASAWQLEPQTRIAADQYSQGQLPLWNPYEGFGVPLAANAISGVFDPLKLPIFLNSTPLAWDIYYLGRVFLGLLLTYAFTRAAGFRIESAVVVAVAYVFSGFMFVYGNNHYIEVYYLLPGLLWGTEEVFKVRLVKGASILLASVALSILAGMPEATLLTFLFAAAYAVFRFAGACCGAQSCRALLPTAGILIGAWVGGLMLAAPLELPLAEYLANAATIHTPDAGLGLLHWPFEEIATIGIPYVFGLPLQPLVIPSGVRTSDYSGSIVLLLAIIGALALYADVNARTGLFALIAGAIVLAKLYGAPIVNEVGQLPLLNETRINLWGQPLLSFSLAILAGVAVQAVREQRVHIRSLLLAASIVVLYMFVAMRANWQYVVGFGEPHFVATMGLAAGCISAISVLLCLRVRLGPRRTTMLAVVAVIGELLALAPRDIYQDRYDPLTTPPFIDFLRQQFSGEPFRIFATDAILYPDNAGAFKLDDIRAVDALYPERYLKFVQHFLAWGAIDRYTGYVDPNGGGVPVSVTDNKWINASNVRFVISAASLQGNVTSLVQSIVDENGGERPALSLTEFTINGDTRPVLFEHPPAQVRHQFTPGMTSSSLTFSLAMSPEVWDSGVGGGVAFTVAVDDGSSERILFTRGIDPKHNPEDRRWINEQVSLAAYMGKPITLILSTEGLDGTAAAWAGWGNLSLGQPGSASQFEHVYDGEVQIYRNRLANARAILVHSVETAANENDAIQTMNDAAFDPNTMAVVEGGVPSEFPSTVASAQATRETAESTQILDDNAQRVVVSANSSQPSLLVLSEAYYPGWTATVDGFQADIHPTDLAFQGVFLSPGNHTIVFRYQPMSFVLGSAIALLGLVVVVPLVLIIALRRQRRARG